MSCARNWCGLVAGLLVLLNAATAIAEELGNYPCKAFGVEARYISLEDLRRLRSLRQEGPSSAAFLDLKKEDLPIVEEALRVGPSGGFFAARLLRDLVLIDAFEQQSQCDPKHACRKPDIIAGFSVDDERSPGRAKSWKALIADWKEFRDKDASRSRACFEVARKLPTFDLPMVAMNEGEPKGQADSGRSKEALSPGIPEQKVAAVEPKRPERSNDECRKQAKDLLANKRIYFSFGKAWVRSSDRKFVADLAGTIASCKSLRIALVGHADSDGPRKYNKRLSRLRAEAVASILRTDGLVGRELAVFGLGESRPVKPNTSRANKAYNRRVTIEVL